MQAHDLVGRETELGRLRHTIAPGRMVVVSGPPGVGKTALIRAALHGRERVLWVELEEARTPQDLWSALGRAASLALDTPERAHAQLVRALRNVTVVVLDQAELLNEEAWSALESLRTARPEVAWLVGAVVASAQASGNERAELQLAPLPLEQARVLLVARTQARALGQQVDPSDPAWETLAERLDGLPLALELAAGRLSLMSPRELLQRLEVAVLRGEDRRTSVEGALRFAWGLLSAPDRQALVRLSLARGFTLELAEGLLGPDALSVLERLRARSALAVNGSRLSVLEGLRRIALEQVDGEAQASFVSWWASWGRRQQQQYIFGPQQEASARLREEQPNLRAALLLALAQDMSEQAVPIALALLLSLRVHGPLWWLDELPDLDAVAARVPAEAGADLLAHWGGALLLLGRTRRARQVLERAIALAQPLGPVSDPLSMALAELGWLELIESNLEAGRQVLQAAHAAAADRPSAALALHRLSTAERLAGDHAAAIAALEAALGQLDEAKYQRQRATLRINLGVLRAEQGRPVEAEDLLRQSASDLTVVDPAARASAALNLGLLILAFGEPEEATAHLAEAASLYERHGGETSQGTAALALALGDWRNGDRQRARDRLLEAASRLGEVDPAGLATVRAWRAALEADSGRPASLAVELEAARADGAEPALVDVLQAFGGGDLPAPRQVETLEVRIARRLVEGGPPGLRCERTGRWFEVSGQRVDLARRGAMRRVLGALIARRLASPGQGLSVQEVFEAGWPEDKAQPDAAATRVYTAVRELRAMGIGEILRKEASGYLLDPSVRLEVE